LANISSGDAELRHINESQQSLIKTLTATASDLEIKLIEVTNKGIAYRKSNKQLTQHIQSKETEVKELCERLEVLEKECIRLKIWEENHSNIIDEYFS